MLIILCGSDPPVIPSDQWSQTNIDMILNDRIGSDKKIYMILRS
jgi:hypothetical protein